MLIELFQIARNLAGQGIETGLVHKDFGIPGLTTLPTLKVVLNEDGEIIRILPITKDEEPGLWTLQSGNFKFFPAVRLRLIPALPVPVELLEKKSVSLQDVIALQELSQHSSVRKIDSEMVGRDNKNRQRIRDWQSNDEGEILTQIKMFSTAFDRFCESPETAALNLLKGVENSLKSPQDDKTLAIFANLLAGKCFAGKRKEGEDRIQLCFDFRPRNDLAFTLYSSRVRQVVLECLGGEKIQTKKVKNSGFVTRVCALTDQPIEMAVTLFPKWSASGVVHTALPPFSKNKDAPCNFRYHRGGTDSFVVEQEAATKLVAGLKSITDMPQGSNWRALRNGKFDGKNEQKDVLIAYPTMFFEDLPLVNLFANANELQEDGIKEFQDLSRSVIEAFSKIAPSTTIPDYIVILLIREISSGQVQLAYSASPSRTEFIEAIEAWNKSARNLPT